MKHLPILIGIAITCVLTALANLAISRVVGLNLFTLKFWLVLPVGALLVGFASASGGILAARVFHIIPNWIDALAMICFAAFSMWLIYYLDYSTLVLDDGRKVSAIIPFGDYVDFTLTKSHMRMGRGAQDVGEVGQFGYWLAGSEFIAFLIGGLASFLIVKGMDRCEACHTYLRKVKTKSSGEIKLDEAGNILDNFKVGDALTIKEILAWKPENATKFEKNEKRARLKYTLLACPKRGSEQIVASVDLYNGKEWNEASQLKTQRQLAQGFSFRSEFI